MIFQLRGSDAEIECNGARKLMSKSNHNRVSSMGTRETISEHIVTLGLTL